MKLALVGYGKMGRNIERLAPEYGCEVKLRLDVDNNANFEGLTADNFRGIDAAIEFSTPHTAVENIERLASLGVNAVVGTTGWLRDIARARAAVEKAGTAVVWSANFSVGVNLFAQIVSEAAQLFARQKEYEAWAWEIHHSAKKDAPSGTLLALVERMKKSGYDRPIDAGSNRAGAQLASIRRTIRSRFAIALADATVFHAAPCARQNGWPAKKAFTSFAKL
jgi:4-hydroxy-tetrahydrodipicolinate reductase